MELPQRMYRFQAKFKAKFKAMMATHTSMAL